jgi:hypothetical protein
LEEGQKAEEGRVWGTDGRMRGIAPHPQAGCNRGLRRTAVRLRPTILTGHPQLTIPLMRPSTAHRRRPRISPSHPSIKAPALPVLPVNVDDASPKNAGQLFIGLASPPPRAKPAEPPPHEKEESPQARLPVRPAAKHGEKHYRIGAAKGIMWGGVTPPGSRAAARMLPQPFPSLW